MLAACSSTCASQLAKQFLVIVLPASPCSYSANVVKLELRTLMFCLYMCRRRQEAQHTGKNKVWPLDWGPGDASRFIDFPELPKSRTQIGPAEKERHMRDGSDAALARPRMPARVEAPQKKISNDLSLRDANDMSSADLDALIFKQRPYERRKSGHNGSNK